MVQAKIGWWWWGNWSGQGRAEILISLFGSGWSRTEIFNFCFELAKSAAMQPSLKNLARAELYSTFNTTLCCSFVQVAQSQHHCNVSWWCVCISSSLCKEWLECKPFLANYCENFILDIGSCETAYIFHWMSKAGLSLYYFRLIDLYVLLYLCEPCLSWWFTFPGISVLNFVRSG